MKLLLLDRPQDESIIYEEEVEFFGPWAQSINTPGDLIKPAFEPYSSPASVYEASLRAMNTASDLLNSLTVILPQLTGLNRGKRFWKMFLGRYVIGLASLVEDIKVRHLSLPEKDYVLGLPQNDFENENIPYSWTDTQYHIFHDGCFKRYAMSLYLEDHYPNHKFIKYMKFQHKINAKRIEEFFIKISHNEYRDFLSKLGSLLFGRFKKWDHVKGLNDNTSSLVWDRYHNYDLDFRKLKTAFLSDQYLQGLKTVPHIQADKERREKISIFFASPFGKLISKTLPLIAMEGLSHLISSINKKNHHSSVSSIKRIYTHGQAYSDKGRKLALLAQLADEGKRIVSIQHGGGSIYSAHSGMFVERIIPDEFISWGSGYSDIRGPSDMNTLEVIPSIYLTNLRRKYSQKSIKKKWRILLVVLEEDRYIKWLYGPLFPDMAFDYFNRQKILFDHFSFKEKTAVKVYKKDYGWGQADWIKSRYPKLQMLSAGKFVNYALRSELVIIDYNSTAFLEMVSMGNPFLATWNRRWFKGGKLFEEFIDKMIDIGVFHEDPAALIESYDKLISSDVYQWWNDSKRQDVLKGLANHFALTSGTTYEEWTKEFERKQ